MKKLALFTIMAALMTAGCAQNPLSFLPLTIILCWYYYKKRNPVPIMVGHAVIDLATAAQIVATSTVPGLYETLCGM